MAKKEVLLAPIDFSRGSARAFDHAVKLARERKAKLIALHVIPAEVIYPPTGGRFDFYRMLEREAREKFNRLAKQKKLLPGQCELMLARGADFGQITRARPQGCAAR